MKGVTGFEEYYVDAPLTPGEHAEELELYATSKDFQERIETAVSRFGARRKFGNWQADIFNKFLTFGGFSTTPHAYNAIDPKDETLTPAEIARLKAFRPVASWVLDGHGVIDFEGVLKAFLLCGSEHITRTIPTDSEADIKQRIGIIRNFLNYLLYHDVCPEYKDQVDAAREVCSRAEKEIWQCHLVSRRLPGGFNTACSSIFGGYYHMDSIGEGNNEEVGFGLGKKLSLRVFQAGMACHSEADIFNKYQLEAAAGRLQAAKSHKTLLVVTGFEFAGGDTKTFYAHSSMYGIEPTGKLQCKTYYDPNGMEEDLTDEEEAEIKANGRPVRCYEFWVEDSVLENMFLGMFIDLEIHETSFGLQYFDTITGTMVSFYHHIPNGDMEGYREHKYLEPRAKHETPAIKAIIPDRGEDIEAPEICNEVNSGKGKENIAPGS